MTSPIPAAEDVAEVGRQRVPALHRGLLPAGMIPNRGRRFGGQDACFSGSGPSQHGLPPCNPHAYPF